MAAARDAAEFVPCELGGKVWRCGYTAEHMAFAMGLVAGAGRTATASSETAPLRNNARTWGESSGSV